MLNIWPSREAKILGREREKEDKAKALEERAPKKVKRRRGARPKLLVELRRRQYSRRLRRTPHTRLLRSFPWRLHVRLLWRRFRRQTQRRRRTSHRRLRRRHHTRLLRSFPWRLHVRLLWRRFRRQTQRHRRMEPLQRARQMYPLRLSRTRVLLPRPLWVLQRND